MTEEQAAPDSTTARLLLAAARQLGETLDLERIYDTFHGLLADSVPHDGIVVSSYDPETREIRCEYAWSGGNRLDTAAWPVLTLNPEGGGMQSRVIRSGETLVFNDVAQRVEERGGTFYSVDSEGKLRKLGGSEPPATHAAVMTPVKHEGEVVGVVQLMSDDYRYGDEHVAILEGVVGLMGAAVRNARLYEASQRLAVSERVLHAVADGIALVDDDGIVRLWNRAAELLTGRRADDAIGRPVADAIRGWERSAHAIPVGGDDDIVTRSATIPVESESGDELWLSVVAVRTAEGIVYAFRDLSHDQRLEQVRSDFIATISHELRTPLAAVFGAAQTLLREDVDFTYEQRRTLLEMIATQAGRLARITEEILLATRLDRGDVRIDREEVDVADVARDTVNDFGQRLPAGLSIDLEAAPRPSLAWGDREKLQQVVANLIDNAVKYSPEGGTVRVVVDDEGDAVRLSVVDTGLGIPAVEHERVFEKFYRADPDLLLGTQGTGLGLYISRELIERMDGRISVESEPGVGSTFRVELPRAAGEP